MLTYFLKKALACGKRGKTITANHHKRRFYEDIPRATGMPNMLSQLF